LDSTDNPITFDTNQSLLLKNESTNFDFARH